MILIKPSYEILAIMHPKWRENFNNTKTIATTPLHLIELAGRTCYKSEERITRGSSIAFVAMLDSLGHESVLEHSCLTVKFICDRGVSHELVRHRLASFSQESTRYCNYKGGVTFVIPPWCNVEPGEYKISSLAKIDSPVYDWVNLLIHAECSYLDLLDLHWTPQQARSVLPNSLKTEIVVTANFREWKHILTLRTSKKAHPQMRELMVPLLKELKLEIPVIFDSIELEE